ncbi:MAG TPA: hypothetical protein VFE84_00290 [Patescibacteria group bacterium]|nr:hypothetical protein [Patescibacteria group bacterium]
MPKFSRGVLRVLGVLAFVALVTPVTASWVMSSTAGRDFSRCIHTCNDTKAACNTRCSDDCFAMFPSNKPQRDACIASCKAICLTQSDDCKLVCQQIKNNPCPTEP